MSNDTLAAVAACERSRTLYLRLGAIIRELDERLARDGRECVLDDLSRVACELRRERGIIERWASAFWQWAGGERGACGADRR